MVFLNFAGSICHLRYCPVAPRSGGRRRKRPQFSVGEEKSEFAWHFRWASPTPFRSSLNSVTYKFILLVHTLLLPRRERWFTTRREKYVPDTKYRCRELLTTSGILLGAIFGGRQYR